MSTVCCPECWQPVNVPPQAREGRCAACRPIRQHSIPRRREDFHLFARRHNRTNPDD
jgi:hypothetical protein